MKTLFHICGAALLVAAPTFAEEITGDATFTWRATGETFMLTETHPYFVGSFAGLQMTADPASPLNGLSIHCPGAYDVGIGAQGYCVTTDHDGDTYVTAWSCTAVDTAPGAIASCGGTATFVAGTGKFAEASGGDNFVAHTVAILPDGTSVGYSTFTDFVLTY